MKLFQVSTFAILAFFATAAPIPTTARAILVSEVSTPADVGSTTIPLTEVRLMSDDEPSIRQSASAGRGDDTHVSASDVHSMRPDEPSIRLAGDIEMGAVEASVPAAPRRREVEARSRERLSLSVSRNTIVCTSMGVVVLGLLIWNAFLEGHEYDDDNWQ
jgi:hypothetical protein